MTYAFVHDVATSWERYRRATAGLVEPPPAGLLLHVAGPTDEGVRVIDVWESEEAWERFHTECLAPAIATLGRPAGPEPTFRDVRPQEVVVGSQAASAIRGPEEEER